ncbi:MAG: tetratricopeptide repeat protein [Desulfovibrionaceae bacterium]
MFWKLFRKSAPFATPSGQERSSGARLEFIPSQDTRAAIDELSNVVRNNSEVVEIYLALGSLYRSQGEIERAIQIRNNLIVRPGLDEAFKARAYFELGRDFRRAGFLDRSAQALQKARELGGDRQAILQEEAKLAAQAGDNERAARLYADLGFPPAQAHHLVQQAREHRREGDAAKSERKLKQALKAYPGSVEAWLEQLIHDHDSGDGARFGKTLANALDAVEPDLRFVLLEGLIEHAASQRECQRDPIAQACPPGTMINFVDDQQLQSQIVPALDRRADALLSYYGARLLLMCGYDAMAKTWLERCLELEPDFWLARLELFHLSRTAQPLSPEFEQQLEFFVDRARHIKRFVCRRCGLRRDTLFFVCPRCQSWHSITFRTQINQ